MPPSHGVEVRGTVQSSNLNGELTGSSVLVRTKSRQYSRAGSEPGKRRMEYSLFGMGRTKTFGAPGLGSYCWQRDKGFRQTVNLVEEGLPHPGHINNRPRSIKEFACSVHNRVEIACRC